MGWNVVVMDNLKVHHAYSGSSGDWSHWRTSSLFTTLFRQTCLLSGCVEIETQAILAFSSFLVPEGIEPGNDPQAWCHYCRWHQSVGSITVVYSPKFAVIYQHSQPKRHRLPALMTDKWCRAVCGLGREEITGVNVSIWGRRKLVFPGRCFWLLKLRSVAIWQFGLAI